MLDGLEVKKVSVLPNACLFPVQTGGKGHKWFMLTKLSRFWFGCKTRISSRETKISSIASIRLSNCLFALAAKVKATLETPH